MASPRKIGSNSRLAYSATGALILCFVVALMLVVLPKLPRYPDLPDERRLFVSTWNFACTLMWVIVFRLQVFNELLDSIKRKNIKRGVTPWVKFWFIASLLIGCATTVYTLHSFVTSPPISLNHLDILTAISLLAWVVLMGTSTSLYLSRKHLGGTLADVEKGLLMHRRLLVPSSFLFFLSTFLFPIFFMI